MLMDLLQIIGLVDFGVCLVKSEVRRQAFTKNRPEFQGGS